MVILPSQKRLPFRVGARVAPVRREISCRLEEKQRAQWNAGRSPQDLHRKVVRLLFVPNGRGPRNLRAIARMAIVQVRQFVSEDEAEGFVAKSQSQVIHSTVRQRCRESEAPRA